MSQNTNEDALDQSCLFALSSKAITNGWEIEKDWFHEHKKIEGEFLPNKDDLFKALEWIKPEEVRLIVVGQDPYPDSKKAMGVAFLADPEKLNVAGQPKEPDSYSELAEYGILPEWGSDHNWLEDTEKKLKANGVLLLNAALTIPKIDYDYKSGGHCSYWKDFVSKLINYILSKNGIGNVHILALGRKAECVVAKAVLDLYNDNIHILPHPSGSSGVKFNEEIAKLVSDKRISKFNPSEKSRIR